MHRAKGVTFVDSIIFVRPQNDVRTILFFFLTFFFLLEIGNGNRSKWGKKVNESLLEIGQAFIKKRDQ